MRRVIYGFAWLTIFWASAGYAEVSTHHLQAPVMPVVKSATGAAATSQKPVAPSAPAVMPGSNETEIRVGSKKRLYTLYVPHKASAVPRPLVVVLHGGGGTSKNAAEMSGFSELAEQENFLVAYPQGDGRVATWNAGKCCGYAERMQVDDVEFIRAMLADIKKQQSVDEKRIYATGMSNGGMMAYRLACEMADVFTAIAPVAGAMNTFTCAPSKPVSVLIFHAVDDQHILYQGGQSEKGLRKLFGQSPKPDASVEEAMRFWLGNNYCRKIPKADRYTDYAVTNFYCMNNVDVRLYTIKSGGHSWPGGKKGYLGADDPLPNLNASKIIWDFFWQHPPHPIKDLK